MKRLVLALVVVAAGCSKKSSEQASATEDMAKRPAGAKGSGSGPGGPVDAGVSPDPVGGSRSRGGIDLDGDLEIAAGAIDKEVVRKVVKDNTTKLQYCYEKTLLANPAIAGKVIATFTIAPEGHVSDVKAAGVHPDVEVCVADAVKAFKFPPSGKKVDVSYPFTFKPA